MITGISLSVTLTVCVHVAVFPEASVAVHVTTVVPIGYGPAGMGPLTVAEQLSVAVAVPIEALEVHCPGSVVRFAVGGQVITGFSLSATITAWVHVAVLPDRSVAVQVTFVVPTGYGPAGTGPDKITEQLSNAVVSTASDDVHNPGSVERFTVGLHNMIGFSLSIIVEV